ncbi:hypothetical protein ADUPG1_012583 [Aduncisulcus paluster]|uniref:Uncharacterized protein n=1 Tax=Aduncisulcus paluster TaxID=2918883 RepID=A0ABQ5K3N2_9EUKA|nr:hypothetical protein ADUPG1_012583 [Aduncisulcus paluster]
MGWKVPLHRSRDMNFQELDRISVRGNAKFSFLYDDDRYADEELSKVGRTSILRVNPKKRSARRRCVTTETHGHLRFKDVLFMAVSLDDYVLKMAMAKPGEDVKEIIQLAIFIGRYGFLYVFWQGLYPPTEESQR